MGDAAASQLSEAMNRLWEKFLPQMHERVVILQNAAARLASGTALSTEEQNRASADAHKLAGVLGTFGLKEGTDLAREAEGLYGGVLEANAATTARLIAIAEQLKAMITSRC
jgi:HPt (histidine-containing phosphotransfer) domain-containing protein